MTSQYNGAQFKFKLPRVSTANKIILRLEGLCGEDHALSWVCTMPAHSLTPKSDAEGWISSRC